VWYDDGMSKALYVCKQVGASDMEMSDASMTIVYDLSKEDADGDTYAADCMIKQDFVWHVGPQHNAGKWVGGGPVEQVGMQMRADVKFADTEESRAQYELYKLAYETSGPKACKFSFRFKGIEYKIVEGRGPYGYGIDWQQATPYETSPVLRGATEAQIESIKTERQQWAGLGGLITPPPPAIATAKNSDACRFWWATINAEVA